MNKTINTNYQSQASHWIAYSGATCHIDFDMSLLVKYSAVTGSEVNMRAKPKANKCGPDNVQLNVTLDWNVCKCLSQNV